MTSPVKLPPLPLEVESVYVDVDGLSTYREARDCYYTMDQMYAYAEQAVREVVTAQAEDEAQHRVNAAMAAEYQRWIDWFHTGRDYDSFLRQGVYGHKPAPMDISSGHNAIIPEKDHGEPS